MLAPDVVKTLVDANWNQIGKQIRSDLEAKKAEADAERYADRFAPFDHDDYEDHDYGY